MAKMLEEIHPGEILLEDFMKPMGLTARQLAADIDPRFWINLQAEYDIPIATAEFLSKVSPRIRVLQRAVA